MLLRYLDSLDINYYLCKNGENDFTENFKNFLLNFASGNIKSSHKLKEIKSYYYSKVNLKINYIFWETTHITSLSLLIMDTKNNFYNMQNIVLSNEFKLISMNLLKNLNIVSLKNNILELNLETIKRITVNNNFRQDFELRRKTGNLIAEKILECFFDDLQKIKMT